MATEYTDDLGQFRDEWNAVISEAIARAWLDPEFKSRLLADPTPILHEAGLIFPERYVVEFYDDPAASAGEWHSIGRGSSAVHRFPIPPVPNGLHVNDSDLAGMDSSALACCCPCASCTGAVSHETWS